jgi:sulfide dehydrogenase cytochrome subunit
MRATCPPSGALLILGIAVLAWPASAAPPPGRLLAAQCAQCHGTDGNADGFDRIAGRPAGDLYNDLLEMKRRPVETIMGRQARGYTDAQLRAIADYVSTLPRRSQ